MSGKHFWDDTGYIVSATNAERLMSERARRYWENWLNSSLSLLELAYQHVQEAAQALLPGQETAAGRAVFHLAVAGILDAGVWWKFVQQGGWLYAEPFKFFPIQRLLEALCSLHEDILPFSEAKSAVSSGFPPFSSTGLLERFRCGSFYAALIRALRPGDGETLETLTDSLFSVYATFTAKAGEDYDAAAAELHGCFAENFRLIRGIAPEDFFADAEQEPSDEDEEISDEEAAANDIEIVHPDRFHALLLERLPALRTAAFADGEPFEEQSLADILTFIAAKDGALALSLWRALLDAADLTDPGEAKKVLWGLPELRGSHGACAPVLDEMEREPALAEQVFHAAVIGSPQRQLLLDCAEAGRTALLRRLWALLGTAPLPEAEWYFRKADLLRQLRKRDPEFDA